MTVPAASYETRFGSLDQYDSGGVDVINDDPRHYAFSNVFAVAAKAKPYVRTAVGKNMQYVLEAVRAEGTSEWFTCAHDEFALVLDGAVEIRLQKVTAGPAVAGKEGAVLLGGEPDGPKMGKVTARRGHMTLLPAGAAYQFAAAGPGVVLLQTIAGELTDYRWTEICQQL